MKIRYSKKKYTGAPPVDGDLTETGVCNVQPNGQITINVPNGTDVMSLTPQGQWETRPAGAHGAWECFTMNGLLLFISPDGGGLYLFAFGVIEP